MTSPPRIVVLHGALGSADQVAHIARGLSSEVDVVTPDLPGHGRRQPGPIDLDEMVGSVLGEVDGATHLVGYSMGGYVALEVAGRRPEAVASVVTIATKLAWTPDIAAAEIARLDPDAMERKVPAFATALDAAHPRAGWRGVVRATATLLAGLGARGPVAGLDAITAPVRLVVGDRDPLVTVEETLAAARELPAGELQVLPGTGHPIDRMPVDVLVAAVRETVRRASGA